MVDFSAFVPRQPRTVQQGTSLLDVIDTFTKSKQMAEQETLQRGQREDVQNQMNILSGQPVGRIGPVEGGKLVFPTTKDRENALMRLTTLDPDMGKAVRGLLEANQKARIENNELAIKQAEEARKKMESEAEFGTRMAAFIDEGGSFEEKQRRAKNAAQTLSGLGMPNDKLVNLANMPRDQFQLEVQKMKIMGQDTKDLMAQEAEEEERDLKEFTENQKLANEGQFIFETAQRLTPEEIEGDRALQTVKGLVDRLGPRGQVTGEQLAQLRQRVPPEAFERIQQFGAQDQTAMQKDFQFAKQQGFKGSFLDFLKSRGAQTNVTVNNMDRELTPLEKKVDEKFTETVDKFNSGEIADTMKNIAQLEGVLTDLESGKELTGPITGNVPDFIQSFINPEAVDARERVEEVVQRNLREVLGAQFTEKEGERLISRAYNPRLDEKTNARRVRALITAMRRTLEAKQSAAEYASKHGTLRGYMGQKEFNMQDFRDAFEMELAASELDRRRQQSGQQVEEETLTPEQQQALDDLF